MVWLGAGEQVGYLPALAANGREWRFIADFTTPGDGWLLLDRCPGGCKAELPVNPSPAF